MIHACINSSIIGRKIIFLNLKKYKNSIIRFTKDLVDNTIYFCVNISTFDEIEH